MGLEGWVGSTNKQISGRGRRSIKAINVTTRRQEVARGEEEKGKAKHWQPFGFMTLSIKIP